MSMYGTGSRFPDPKTGWNWLQLLWFDRFTTRNCTAICTKTCLVALKQAKLSFKQHSFSGYGGRWGELASWERLQSGTLGKFLVFRFEIFPEKDSMRQFILIEFKCVRSDITNVANLFCVSSRNSIFLILRMEEIEGGFLELRLTLLKLLGNMVI